MDGQKTREAQAKHKTRWRWAQAVYAAGGSTLGSSIIKVSGKRHDRFTQSPLVGPVVCILQDPSLEGIHQVMPHTRRRVAFSHHETHLENRHAVLDLVVRGMCTMFLQVTDSHELLVDSVDFSICVLRPG